MKANKKKDLREAPKSTEVIRFIKGYYELIDGVDDLKVNTVASTQKDIFELHTSVPGKVIGTRGYTIRPVSEAVRQIYFGTVKQGFLEVVDTEGKSKSRKS